MSPFCASPSEFTCQTAGGAQWAARLAGCAPQGARHRSQIIAHDRRASRQTGRAGRPPARRLPFRQPRHLSRPLGAKSGLLAGWLVGSSIRRAGPLGPEERRLALRALEPTPWRCEHLSAKAKSNQPKQVNRTKTSARGEAPSGLKEGKRNGRAKSVPPRPSPLERRLNFARCLRGPPSGKQRRPQKWPLSPA